MREIVSVFGLPDKPMEVTVPKDLVRCFSLVIRKEFRVLIFFVAYYYDVALQCRIPVRCRFPPSGHDECPRRMAVQARR